MDAQQIVVWAVVGSAACWLAWKLFFRKKGACGCSEDCPKPAGGRDSPSGKPSS